MIHFGEERLNNVFQKLINSLEAGQFTFGPAPRPLFFTARPLEDILGERIDSRDSSKSGRSSHPDSTSLEKDVTKCSTPQSSVVSVVIVEKGNGSKTLAEGPGEASKARYLERVKNLDLEE